MEHELKYMTPKMNITGFRMEDVITTSGNLPPGHGGDIPGHGGSPPGHGGDIPPGHRT